MSKERNDRYICCKPYCGFFMIPNENLDEVEISGCDNGID